MEGGSNVSPVGVTAEFTVYPFREGNALPGHVRAAIDAVRSTGVEVQVGALSNTISGGREEVLEALRAAQSAALAAGATRIVVSVEVRE